jgi:predicted transcriptional regulator
VVKVRIPDPDLRALETIAEAEGSNVSALIRKAVKEFLRRQGAGLR